MEVILQQILKKLEVLETGQNSLQDGQQALLVRQGALEARQEVLQDGQQALLARQGALEARQEVLQDGQQALLVRQGALESRQEAMEAGQKELYSLTKAIEHRLDAANLQGMAEDINSMKGQLNRLEKNQKEHERVLSLLASRSIRHEAAIEELQQQRRESAGDSVFSRTEA